jgi:hypothetical protein
VLPLKCVISSCGSAGGVDARLKRIRGHRPKFLRRSDLPTLARVLVAYHAHQARVHRDFVAGVAVIHLESGTLSVLIRGEDWSKILPLIKDRAFHTSANYPDPAIYIARANRKDGPEERVDPSQYQRILSHLEVLFPEDFPSSGK